MYAFFGKRYIYRMNSYNLASLLAEFLAPYASSASGGSSSSFFLLRAILKTPHNSSSLCAPVGITFTDAANVHDAETGLKRGSRDARDLVVPRWRRLTARRGSWTILRHSNYLPTVRLGIIRISMRRLPSVSRRGGYAFGLRSARDSRERFVFSGLIGIKRGIFVRGREGEYFVSRVNFLRATNVMKKEGNFEEKNIAVLI